MGNTGAPLHIFNIDDAKRVTTYKLADDTNVFRQDSDENAPTNQEPANGSCFVGCHNFAGTENTSWVVSARS